VRLIRSFILIVSFYLLIIRDVIFILSFHVYKRIYINKVNDILCKNVFLIAESFSIQRSHHIYIYILHITSILQACASFAISTAECKERAYTRVSLIVIVITINAMCTLAKRTHYGNMCGSL